MSVNRAGIKLVACDASINASFANKLDSRKHGATGLIPDKFNFVFRNYTRNLHAISAYLDSLDLFCKTK